MSDAMDATPRKSDLDSSNSIHLYAIQVRRVPLWLRYLQNSILFTLIFYLRYEMIV
jgi:hypothetical protein